MIISCPQCATTQELPAEAISPAGARVHCTACGHRWLHERHPGPYESTRIIDDPQPDARAALLDKEARLLAAAALRTERARARRTALRRVERHRWLALGAAWLMLLGAFFAFPDHIVRWLPGSGWIYARLGMPVNPTGFAIGAVQTGQVLTASGQVMLAVQGRLTNITPRPKAAPGLRFILRDAGGKVLHSWVLPAVTAGDIGGHRAAPFISRIANPPAGARSVEVRLLSDAQERS